MNTRETKITTQHLRRLAYLYIRQSTLKQVFEHVESTKRQYALKQKAMTLGWSEEQIIVIDDDQGESGASAANRNGFQRLVSEVGLGRAGIVMGLEVSRLARNCADWHRLLEICALSDTLILDEDGIYDPGHFNDRLLLGLKGTMSEAELYLIRARLQGGILNKARRGELQQTLPVGFVHDGHGRVILDPDRQVQDAIRYFFNTFRRTGSVHAMVTAYRAQGLMFPRRDHWGANRGVLQFKPLTAGRALSILHNPRYAGAFFYGRVLTRKRGTGKHSTYRVPREDWHVLIPGAYEGYITWAEFEENERHLKSNATRYGLDGISGSPPREGAALLQGRVICGHCGRHMRVHYHKNGQEGTTCYQYRCDRWSFSEGEPECLSVSGKRIDVAVSRLVLDAVTPMALQAALEVQQEIETRIDEAGKLRQQRVLRARYEVNLAQRRYLQVDPDNRLVADVLELAWNEKLKELEQAEDDLEREQQKEPLLMDGEKRGRVLALAEDFPRLWEDPAVPSRERKRMLALLIEDVTLLREDKTGIAHVRFKGGRTQTLRVPLPLGGLPQRVTSPEAVAEMDRLLNDFPHDEIARRLNQQGFKTGWNKDFTPMKVSQISKAHGLLSRFDRLRARGLLTSEELLEIFPVSRATLFFWQKERWLTAYHVSFRYCLFEDHIPDRIKLKYGVPTVNLNHACGSHRQPESSTHGGVV